MKHAHATSIWEGSDKEEEKPWKMGGKEDPFSSCSLQKWNPAKPIGQDQHQPPSCLVTKPKFDGGRVRKSNGPQLFKWELTEESIKIAQGWRRNVWRQKRSSCSKWYLAWAKQQLAQWETQQRLLLISNMCSGTARWASGEGGSGNTLWRNSCHKAREAEAQGKARAAQDTELQSAESKATTDTPEQVPCTAIL